MALYEIHLCLDNLVSLGQKLMVQCLTLLNASGFSHLEIHSRRGQADLTFFKSEYITPFPTLPCITVSAKKYKEKLKCSFSTF